MNPFWNKLERRIRAGWRMVIQLVLFMGILVLFVFIDDFFTEGWPRTIIGEGDSILLPLEMFLATLISVWIAGRFLDRRPLVDFGLRFNRSWWSDLGAGFMIGASVITGIYLTMKVAGWVEITGMTESYYVGMSFVANFIIVFLVILVMAANEELNGRGYWIRNISEGMSFGTSSRKRGVVYAVGFSSLLFGLAHVVEHATILSTLNLVLGGAAYALVFVWTGQLALPLGFHVGWNFVQGCVFGFNVSGVPFGTTLLAVQQKGQELWTGGAEFGPEAGLLGVGGHLAGLLIMAAWIKMRQGSIGIQPAFLRE
jgi:membrane protease YdiL (CAAX protease family)